MEQLIHSNSGNLPTRVPKAFSRVAPVATPHSTMEDNYRHPVPVITWLEGTNVTLVDKYFHTNSIVLGTRVLLVNTDNLCHMSLTAGQRIYY